jgi:hypothetical protein
MPRAFNFHKISGYLAGALPGQKTMSTANVGIGR